MQGVSFGMLSKEVVLWDVKEGVVNWDVFSWLPSGMLSMGLSCGMLSFLGLLPGCHLGCYLEGVDCDVVIWDFIIGGVVILDAKWGLLSGMLSTGVVISDFICGVLMCDTIIFGVVI